MTLTAFFLINTMTLLCIGLVIADTLFIKLAAKKEHAEFPECVKKFTIWTVVVLQLLSFFLLRYLGVLISYPQDKYGVTIMHIETGVLLFHWLVALIFSLVMNTLGIFNKELDAEESKAYRRGLIISLVFFSFSVFNVVYYR